MLSEYCINPAISLIILKNEKYWKHTTDSTLGVNVRYFTYMYSYNFIFNDWNQIIILSIKRADMCK